MPDTVNPQIIDAVQQTQQLVIDANPKFATRVVQSNVTHAVGLAIADATDYVRNVTALSTAITGVALRKMLEDVSNVPQATAALTAAISAVEGATKNLESVGRAAASVLTAWPSGQ
jgi:L-fucose mutarotase/ribose pyranase (RbsD/FucU family)